ncbi:hypothetical protein DDE05_30225, partial [Streptomyces cavourensis]
LEAQSDGTLLVEVEVEWAGPRQPPGELLRIRVRDDDGDDGPSEYLLPLVTAANGRVVGTMNVPVSGERVTVELDPEPLAPDGLDDHDLGAVPPLRTGQRGGLALRRWKAWQLSGARRTGCAGPLRQRGPVRRPGPCPDSATKAHPSNLPPPTPPVASGPTRHRHLPVRPSAAAERVKSEEHEEPMAGTPSTPGTPETPRTAGRKPLSVLLDEQTGTAQGWLSACRTALTAAPGTLDGLLAPDGDVAAALEN